MNMSLYISTVLPGSCTHTYRLVNYKLVLTRDNGEVGTPFVLVGAYPTKRMLLCGLYRVTVAVEICIYFAKALNLELEQLAKYLGSGKPE